MDDHHRDDEGTSDDGSGSPPLEGRGYAAGVRFAPSGQVVEVDTGTLRLRRGDRVLVDGDRGPTVGTVTLPPRRRRGSQRLPRAIRRADGRDLMREDTRLQRERRHRDATLEALRAHRPPLKLVKIDAEDDGARVTIFVATEERLDLRDLARRLSQPLQAQVEIRQIGARDEARAAGGLGVCGRELCCSSWLREFQAVALRMAKAQGLALNQSKLAGQCGRLKCCLRYEFQTYQELKKGLPAIGSQVQSVRGDGKVVAHNVLKRTVVVRRADDGINVEATLEDLVAPRNDG